MSPALLAALLAVESGGNNHAIGDHGRAIGALQIHAAVVADVNRIHGTRYTHAGMARRSDAVAVATLYLGTYATRERLGRAVTDADRARIWNGGPDGWR
ncbi:MAG: hypothetical protein EBR82_76055, partial [Caulobacteraceae bacterium]|nr:hypothetical protein [Caulobacteraceae bacterium]